MPHPPEPAPSPPHVVGDGYDFQAIRAQLGGESTPPNFVIHRDQTVLGLCLGLMWNPLAESDPCEVWVGRKGDLPKWGGRLAETKGPLPVYVRREQGGEWFFIGLQQVVGSSAEPEAIRERLKPPVITAISQIVFLKPYDPASPPPTDDTPSPPASSTASTVHDQTSSTTGDGPQSEASDSAPPPEPPPAQSADAERTHPRDPLHGITLETVINRLLKRHGWEEMARRVPVRCFQYNPSVKSSLTFLRKTPWARQKLQDWFISEL